MSGILQLDQRGFTAAMTLKQCSQIERLSPKCGQPSECAQASSEQNEGTLLWFGRIPLQRGKGRKS
jgi:hypothetical protein